MLRAFRKKNARYLIFLSLIGPGLITAIGDNDAGGIASDSAAASTQATFLLPLAAAYAVCETFGFKNGPNRAGRLVAGNCLTTGF